MTECGDIRKQFGCIYMTSSHLITCLCWWKKNHVGCFPVEVMGSMLNEQISCVLVEWSLLAAVSCWGLLLYCIVESPPPPKLCLASNTRFTLLFHWRGTGMHIGMPLGVFVDTRVTTPLSDVDKDVLLGFTRFSPWRRLWELWSCHAGYRDS